MADEGAPYIAQVKLLKKGAKGFEPLIEVSTPIWADNDSAAAIMAAEQLDDLLDRASKRHLRVVRGDDDGH